MWRGGEEGISSGEKEKRRRWKVQVWEGKRREAKEDSEMRNQRGKLTKDGRDVAEGL